MLFNTRSIDTYSVFVCVRPPKHSNNGSVLCQAFAVGSCLADLASFALLYMIILLDKRKVKSFFLLLLGSLETLGIDGRGEHSIQGVEHTQESQRRKEGIGESAELMMPTLRDSTMSHPGENSHQVRVKAYYKG